jgi:hypothetical protein
MDGDFAYYEALTKWTRSGQFDREPGPEGIQPEEDATTYNGSIWTRARELFGPTGPEDPRYAQAISYYEKHAYDARFLWDWSGRQAAFDEFRRLVAESDDRFRSATTALGAVLANHLLSGVDAYLSAGFNAEAQARVIPSSDGRRWTLLLHATGTW